MVLRRLGLGWETHVGPNREQLQEASHLEEWTWSERKGSQARALANTSS